MGTVHLTDFGLAKATATGPHYTRTGEALGTPAYMPPEQARGETTALTPAADVWSLGCVLYELLTGRRAFDGDSAAQIIGAVLANAPARPAGVPRAVHVLLAGCLAHAPARRYPDARALADDCARLLAGDRPRGRPGRRRAALAMAALAVAAGGTLAALPDGRAAAPPPAPADRLAAQAREVRDGDPGRGAALLATALTLAPARHDLQVERGLLLWRAGDLPGAQACWARVPDADPAAADARLYRAIEGLFRLSGAAVRADLEWLAARGGPHAPLARGALAAVDRDYAAARARIPPGGGWPAAALRAYVEQAAPDGDPSLARRLADEAIAAGARFARIYQNRSLLRSRAGDLEGALSDLDAALALDPAHVPSLVARATIRARRGDAEGAGRDLDLAVTHAPNDLPARINRSAHRQERGDRLGAVADIAWALGVDPTCAPALANRALSRLEDGDRAGAIADLDAAVAADPHDADIRGKRANLRVTCGDLAGAAADLDVALDLEPRSVTRRMVRARVRARLGDRAGAVADYDAVLAAEPRHFDALTARASLRADLGDDAGRLRDLDAALVVDPAHRLTRVNRGLARERLGDLAGARADLDHVLAADPRFPPALITRARLRAATGDAAGALEDGEAALAVSPAGWAERDRLLPWLAELRARAR